MLSSWEFWGGFLQNAIKYADSRVSKMHRLRKSILVICFQNTVMGQILDRYSERGKMEEIKFGIGLKQVPNTAGQILLGF